MTKHGEAPKEMQVPSAKHGEAPKKFFLFLFLIRKRKRVLVLASFLTLMLLTGCTADNFLPAGSEITSYEIVRVLGIDAAAEGEVEVTLIAERPKPSPGEEGGGMSYEVMSSKGPTAFEAVTKLRAKTDKKQVFGYVDYIIFGENTASEDFTKFADYPARNPEIRYSPKVFMTHGTTAKELISDTSSGDKYIGDSLDNMLRSADGRSDFTLLKNIELMNMLDNRESAAVIPALEAKEAESGKMIDGEKPEKKLAPAGYAVLRDYKLAGYFGTELARGYNLLCGEARSCAFSVRDGAGEFAGLDVLSEGVTITPHWSGETLSGVTYTVRASAGVAEQRSLVRLNTPQALALLNGRLEDAIEEEVRRAVEKSKEFGVDCFGLGKFLSMTHPYRWRELEDSWREIYDSLDIAVTAEAEVRRVYDIREPSGFDDPEEDTLW